MEPDHSRPLTRKDALKLGLIAGIGAAGLSAAPAVAQGAAEGQSLNALSFGATGDGVSDDTQALQAAIDVCARAGGGRVHIPAGRYRLTAPLVINSADRIDLTGDGWSTRLLQETDAPVLLWPEDKSCRESSVRNLAITATTTDKSPTTPAIACLGGAERSFFHHLLFDRAGVRMGSGIITEQVTDTTTFDHCLFWGGVSGTGIKVARGSEVRIFGGRILGHDRENFPCIGVHLTNNNGGVHILTTDIIGLHTGLKIGEEGNPSNREVFITHATFDSSVYGIRQVDNAYTSIAGLWAASSDEAQIQIEENSPGAIMAIAGGTIFNGGAYGRPGAHNGFVAKSGSFTLTGVTVRNNQGSGLVIGERARDWAITGCRIAENGQVGSLAGANWAFTGNVLARNGAPPEVLSEGVMVGNAGL